MSTVMTSARELESGPVGDPDELLPSIYEQLRDLAEQWFVRQPRDHTLQPTAVVHEAYLRMAGGTDLTCRSRAHFFAVAASAMRQVLIDHARRRSAVKRGRAWRRVTLADAAGHDAFTDVDLIDLDEALERLSALNPRQSRIVELRFLAGLTVDETASILGVAARTVRLDWRMARAWLMQALDGASRAESGQPKADG